MRKIKWIFYDMSLDADGNSVYTKKGDSSEDWPFSTFKELAEVLGYTLYKADTTIFGGYFCKRGIGNCLLCVPNGIDPKNIYG